MEHESRRMKEKERTGDEVLHTSICTPRQLTFTANLFPDQRDVSHFLCDCVFFRTFVSEWPVSPEGRKEKKREKKETTKRTLVQRQEVFACSLLSFLRLETFADKRVFMWISRSETSQSVNPSQLYFIRSSVTSLSSWLLVNDVQCLKRVSSTRLQYKQFTSYLRTSSLALFLSPLLSSSSTN